MGTPPRNPDAVEETVVSTEAAAPTRLHGRRLVLARATWVTLILLTLGLFSSGILPSFNKYIGEAEKYLPYLAQLGLSDRFYATYKIVLELVVMLVFTLVALVIYWRKADDWMVLFVSITLVTFGAEITDPVYRAKIHPAWVVVSGIGFSSMLLYCYIFPDGRFIPRWTFLPAIVYTTWTFTWHVFTRAPFSPWQWPPMAELLVLLAWYSSGLAAQIYRYVRVSSPSQRQQSKWVVFGLLGAVFIFAVAELSSYIFPALQQPGIPRLLYKLVSVTIFDLAMLLVPLSVGISILRYRLWDIDILINRSLVYGTLTVLLASLYLLLVRLLTLVVQAIAPGGNETPVVFAATLTIALAAAPLRQRVQATIDRAFYRTKLNYQRLLPEITAQLATHIVLERLTPLLTDELPRHLQICHASLLVLDPEDQALTLPHDEDRPGLPLEHPLVQLLHRSGRPLLRTHAEQSLAQAASFLRDQHVELSIPLIVGQRLVGLYNLGGKLSGTPFSHDEIDLLTVLGQQLAVSVENARLYHEIESYSHTLEEQVYQRTRELQSAYGDLAEQNETLNVVLGSIADGLVVTGQHGHILLVNPAFARLIGWPASELPGRELRDVLPSPRLLGVVAAAQDDPDTVSTADVVLPNRRVLRASVGVLRGADRRATGVVTVLRDITEEVEVARMKDDFVSMVSHELRTPLTSVLGFAKLIRRFFQRDILPSLSPDSEKAQQAQQRIKENLNIIIDEGERLTRLINDVLDIARMEAGRIQWEMGQVALPEVIQSSVQAIQGQAQEKHLTIDTEAGADLPPLHGDRDRLVQVVTNLLSNAVKFTDEGHIEVRAWPLQPGDDIVPYGSRQPDASVELPATAPLVAVSVTDTGIGIAKADLPKVFERFQQVGDRRSGTRRLGTGLGLTICKEIVEYHQGHIWVESTPGSGSRFLVVLPVAQEAQEADT